MSFLSAATKYFSFTFLLGKLACVSVERGERVRERWKGERERKEIDRERERKEIKREREKGDRE